MDEGLSIWLHRQRRRVYELLEVGRAEDRVSRWIDRVLIGLILLNVAAFAAETAPAVEEAYGPWLHLFDRLSVGVFTIEYALRVWSCVEMPFLRKRSAWRARLFFASRPHAVIDLMAILPFYLGALLPLDLRVLRLFRVLRLLKLARYSPALHALVQVMINERRALAGALILMMVMLLFSATGMYWIEHQAQPEAFGTIPDAAWWAMATLTTVGYGDVTPITPLGKFFGGIVMIMGLGMFALPIAIIASGFAEEVRRRDFVVTWPLLARIPHLAELEAEDVVRLIPHLRSQDFPPHWDVAEQGDHAGSMYFIASGSVRRHGPQGESVLSAGDFFGEGAVLEHGTHDSAFTTASRVRVLELQRRDFHHLEHASPDLARHIRRVAELARGGPGSVAEAEAADAAALEAEILKAEPSDRPESGGFGKRRA